MYLIKYSKNQKNRVPYFLNLKTPAGDLFRLPRNTRPSGDREQKKARPRLKSLPLLDRVTSDSDLAYILHGINTYHKQSVECSYEMVGGHSWVFIGF